MQSLRKGFGATLVVDDFSLHVADGEFVALLGPSGCGKTTVMRMLAGITPLGGGEISVAGQRIDHLPPERRKIGLVFQSYALFPHMTVGRNVGFGLQMQGMAAAAIKQRVTATLELVDLARFASRYPRELSGGQQQRVALARAIATRPQALLLDEPLSNLDAKLREQLRDDLKALQRRLGTTTLYVTHDQSEAMALADRVVVMNAGRIVEIGAPRDLYQSPRERFTAEFLGHINIVPAEPQNGGLVTPWGQMVQGKGESGPQNLCVRPEDLALTADPDGKGQITEVTFLGAEVEHRVAVAGLSLRARASGRAAPVMPVGTRVALSVPQDAQFLAASGA